MNDFVLGGGPFGPGTQPGLDRYIRNPAIMGPPLALGGAALSVYLYPPPLIQREIDDLWGHFRQAGPRHPHLAEMLPILQQAEHELRMLAANNPTESGNPMSPVVTEASRIQTEAINQVLAFEGAPLSDEERAQALEHVRRILDGEEPDPNRRPPNRDEMALTAAIIALVTLETGLRVTGNRTRRCRTLRLCFMPRSPSIDMNEYRRQLGLQERALNGMTPQQMLINRAMYLLDPEGMRRASAPLQQQARIEYEDHIRPDYENEHGDMAQTMIDDHMDTVVALHNPDMIAGGDYASVIDRSLPIRDRIGSATVDDEFAGSRANSAMGSGWRGSRSRRLQAHAEQQAANGCPSVQVELDVCESVPGSPGLPREGAPQ